MKAIFLALIGSTALASLACGDSSLPGDASDASAASDANIAPRDSGHDAKGQESSPGDIAIDAHLDAANDIPPNTQRESSSDTLGTDGDAAIDQPNDVAETGFVFSPDQCAAPVIHGWACALENDVTCGYARVCTDVLSNVRVPCTCRGGAYDCGSLVCPPCSLNLRSQFCGGASQSCTGVTFTRCDGSTFHVDGTCTCGVTTMDCGAEGLFTFGCQDAGPDAAQD